MLRAVSRSRHAFSHRFASTLVVAEHSEGVLSQNTLAAVTAAREIGQPIRGVVLGGGDAKGVADAFAKVAGVTAVDVIASDKLQHLEPERVVSVLRQYVKQGDFSHVLVGSSGFTKNFFPRLAALLDVSPITDVVKINSPDTFVRPTYAGNIMHSVKSKDALKLVSVRPTNFAAAAAQGSTAAVSAVNVEVEPSAVALSQWVETRAASRDRPDLASAKIVVSGGRALKSSENFKIIYDLADKLKAAVGASRAAVDAGYVSNELQVGQTGKVVAPDIYFAVGISGAIQHLAGMKDSKCIVVINKDPEAPFFQNADYGLVGDLFKIVPELQAKLP